ncbi:MAG: 6-pyruvoyl tetrahydropterin synthase family protein [Candidatus Tectimicrobiota bacterium]
MATWLILEDDRFNFDYCHFLPWHSSQCRSLHGHSSLITVLLCGEPDAQGFVIDFGIAKRLVKEALDLFDHKVIAPRTSLTGAPDARGLVEIAFDTVSGPHRLLLPATEVAIIDGDATVENLSAILAAAIYQRMPSNVQRVLVRMFEGIGKSALSMVGVADHARAVLLPGTDPGGRVLSIEQLLVQMES